MRDLGDLLNSAGVGKWNVGVGKWNWNPSDFRLYFIKFYDTSTYCFESLLDLCTQGMFSLMFKVEQFHCDHELHCKDLTSGHHL